MNNRRTSSASLALGRSAAVALALILAACGTGSAEEPAALSTTPAPEPTQTVDAGPTLEEASDGTASESALADGSFAALIEAEEGRVALDEIEILSGEEAAAAREADGEPPVEEGLDVPYLRNRSEDVRTLDVADDVVVAVYDCIQACEHVEWRYADLAAGTPLPYGDVATAPFVVTVEDGVVVELSEVYLP